MGEPADAPRVVVLVGEAARDHDRVDALLSASVTVILIPSLETVSSFKAPGGELRREASAPRQGTTVGDLRVDLEQHRVFLGQRQLHVSERELAVLATLCDEAGRARSFADLVEPGGRWREDTERVHSTVKRLRAKLARARAEATIESVRGYGFRLVGRSMDSQSPNISGEASHHLPS